MNTRYSASFPVVAVLFVLVFFFQAGTASAAGTIYKCVGQPTTLSWSSSNVTSCTPSAVPSTCSFSPSPNQPGSTSIAAGTSCNVGLTCSGPGGTASDSAALVIDTTKTWNGSACVAAPVAPTISFSRSPSTLYQGQSQTTSYSTTGATSVSGSCSGAGGAPLSYPGMPLNQAPYSQTWDSIWNAGYHGSWYCTWTAVGPGGSASAGDSFNIAPVVTAASITASPMSIAYGGRATLTWSSSNATSCTATGPWSNSGTLSGNGLTNPLTANTTFGFQCTGPTGTSPGSSVTVSVAPASPCTLPWGGSIPSGSSVTAYSTSSVVAPTACSAVAETRTCSNGSLSGSYTNQSCAQRPAASISASPSTIVAGQSATISWSSVGATSCSIPSVSSGPTAGSATVSPLTTSTYSITCTSPGGSSDVSFATVTVLQPTATISATPARLQAGSPTVVSWSSSNVVSCSVTKNGAAWKTGTASAGVSDTVNVQTTYTIDCRSAGSPVSQSVIVNVTPAFQQF